ncbi:MAG TPA: copper-binding protein [Magnetospirillaceae bacterium]|nr:copper-binding protein [Magnetospirillaceae bacterium]
MIKLAPALTAIFALTSASASPALPAGEIHGAGPALQLVHQGHDHIHASGTVNSIDEAGRKVNLSHGPIPQVGWPAMTMDFTVAPSVDLKAIAPGAHVDFTLEKGADGLFQVESLTPAAVGK